MKKLFLFSIFLNIILVVVLGVAFYKLTHTVKPKPAAVAQKPSVQSLTINKSWDLPATSSAKAATFTLVISKIEKTDKIISDGKSYTTKNNRSFLVVNTVVENKGSSSLQLSPSDFVKLMSDGKEVEALYKALSSTIAANKAYNSSMVFLVDENAKSFTFSIGSNVNKMVTLPISF